MPKYRVQLKQGKRTIVEHVEAKDDTHCLQFFNTITTMRVSEILKVVYSDDLTPPIDDYNYYSLFKGMLGNSDTRQKKQIILHNIKKTITENEIFAACILHLDINGANIDNVTASLMKA